MTYAQDSFFTLSQFGQIGLALLSAVLAVATLGAAYRLMRGYRILNRLVLAGVVFALFVWLSPQIYYTYYRMIIEGLPAQWVIGLPPLGQMVRYACFTADQSLSAHSQGLLFWALVLLALRGSRQRGPRA